MKILYDNWRAKEKVNKNLACLMQACQSKDVNIQQCLSFLDKMIFDLKKYNIEGFEDECYRIISSMLESTSGRYDCKHLYHDLILKSDLDFSIKPFLSNLNKKQLQKQIEIILIRFS